jgi:agmatine deiminase
MPGEFEPQDAIWLGWPKYDHLYDYPLEPVFVELIAALENHVDVKVAVCGGPQEQYVRGLLADANVPLENISFHNVLYWMEWYRDIGPVFLTDDQGGLLIADYGFNLYGYAPESTLDDWVDRQIAWLLNVGIKHTCVYHEGGNHEVNGRGTLMLVEAVERNRNPWMTRAAIEAEHRRVLNVSNVIWLKEGAYEDSWTPDGPIPGPTGEYNAYTMGTGGHIDEIARFINENTVLLAEATPEEAASDPVAAENRRRMEENYQVLLDARLENGEPINIVRVPIPETMYMRLSPFDWQYWFFWMNHGFPLGDRIYLTAATSYLNFVITNNAVIVPQYWQDGYPDAIRQKDEAALVIFRLIFPDREIVTINPLAMNWGGGGMHCVTQQQPNPFIPPQPQ